MIARWLWALRCWWFAPVIVRLNSLEERIALFAPPSRVVAGGHVLVMWDCGHEHAGGARDREGITRCLDCHERLIAAASREAP